MTERTDESDRKVEAVEAVAERWSEVLTEAKQTAGPRWILDRSITTLDTALTELRRALALHAPPATPRPIHFGYLPECECLDGKDCARPGCLDFHPSTRPAGGAS